MDLGGETALNLTLSGSVGTFNVGNGCKGQHSIGVKFFLTHLGFDFSSGSNEALLSNLAPVREIFNYEELDFDQIMQRDIDDARVSSELIPYLLDSKSHDLVKLFPPIIVIVLPVIDGTVKPAGLYPKVDSFTFREEGQDKHGIYKIRSGIIGEEVFEFEMPIKNGKQLKHDLARLRLNTHKTKLVIVDGQHRAMALLALYRNIKDQWSDEKRAPFKDYYLEWTKNYISQFDIKEINMPIMLCTFPSLDENYKGDSDLFKAARSIFLTLNKTARPVSESRNILLNDSDIISNMLRSCLSVVKQRDVRSQYSMRIFNVELDQSDNKQRIQSPISITGVNHIYYIIEHLMLDNGNVKGVSARSGYFKSRTDLEVNNCMKRLDGRNILGSEVADDTSRIKYTAETADKLTTAFMKSYGDHIISFYEQFMLYEIHNRAVLRLEQFLLNEGRKLRPILFDGQGIGKVFESHRMNLKQKIKEGIFETEAPKIEEIAKSLDVISEQIHKAVEQFKSERTEFILAESTNKAEYKTEDKYHQSIIAWHNYLYDNIFTTVAFQAAVICGYFGILEMVNDALEKADKPKIKAAEYFQEYIEQLNKFFVPKTPSQFRKIVKIFRGELEGPINEWKVVPTNFTFKHVVFRGEMQPDEWPKYRYLILEIWRPSKDDIKNIVFNEIQECRRQIFLGLYKNYKKEYCQRNMKAEEGLVQIELEQIFNNVLHDYNAFLNNIGTSTLKENEMRKVISNPSAADMDDTGVDENEQQINCSV